MLKRAKQGLAKVIKNLFLFVPVFSDFQQTSLYSVITQTAS
jgi:hypothetical protein